MIKFLRIGKIVKPQGIKGEVKVLVTTSDINRFKSLKNVYLHIDEEASDEIILNNIDIKEVIEVKFLKDFVILKLKNVDSVEDAEKIRNMSLYVNREDSYKLKQNEYFLADLNGLDVKNIDNNEIIGKVTDILETKTQSILVIKNESKEVLIPLVDEFIKNIDSENKLIQVKLLEGMIE